jgi:hypothetical protein
VESSFHATVTCTKAKALRHEMRKHWTLPPESFFEYTGPEWLQNLLLASDQSQRSKILMLLWRSWHLRNDIIHGNGKETIHRSAAFLLGYDNFLHDPGECNSVNTGSISHHTQKDLLTNNLSLDTTREKKAPWSPPKASEIKMNVDAAFCADTGEAAAGVVFRNHSGEPIAVASSVLEGCNDAEEAEAIAVLTGMNLAVQLNLKPAIVESDNAGVVKALNGLAPHMGTSWHIYRNILQRRGEFPGCVFSKVNRLGNGVAHELASLAKVSRNSVVWLPPFPDFIKFICNSDYVSNSATIN